MDNRKDRMDGGASKSPGDVKARKSIFKTYEEALMEERMRQEKEHFTNPIIFGFITDPNYQFTTEGE